MSNFSLVTSELNLLFHLQSGKTQLENRCDLFQDTRYTMMAQSCCFFFTLNSLFIFFTTFQMYHLQVQICTGEEVTAEQSQSALFTW